MSRMLTAGSWLAATAVATSISWTGVAAVTGDVTGGRPPMMSAADLAALGPPAAPDVAAVEPTTDVAADALPAEVAAPAPKAAPPPTATPPATAALPANAPEAVPPPPASAAVAPRPASPAAAARPTPVAGPQAVAPVAATRTATFASRGGVIVVACDSDLIRLVSARPRDGYRLVTRSPGPFRVEVDFLSDQAGSRMGVICAGGTPQLVPRDGPGSSGSGSRRSGPGDRDGDRSSTGDPNRRDDGDTTHR